MREVESSGCSGPEWCIPKYKNESKRYLSFFPHISDSLFYCRYRAFLSFVIPFYRYCTLRFMPNVCHHTLVCTCALYVCVWSTLRTAFSWLVGWAKWTVTMLCSVFIVCVPVSLCLLHTNLIELSQFQQNFHIICIPRSFPFFFFCHSARFSFTRSLKRAHTRTRHLVRTFASVEAAR